MRARSALLIGLSLVVAAAAATLACAVAATALGASESALGSESRHSLPPATNTLLMGEPVISPEYPVSLPVGGNPQLTPAIAFDGTNYLVVWEESRAGQDGIYGARVGQDGAPLDGTGFAIATGSDERAPTVAFNGTNYLVTWEHEHVFSGEHSEWISAARVSPQGVVLDPGGFTVSNQAWFQFRPFVASDGADYLVAWARSPDRSGVARDVWAARVSAGGVVLDPNAVLICQVPGNEDPSAVAFDGTNYLVAWDDHREGFPEVHIFGARVSPAGSVLDPGGLPISSMSGSQDLAAAAFDGTNYLLAWQESSSDIRGTRLTPEFGVLDPQGIDISTAAGSQSKPAVAFNGMRYIGAWEDRRSSSSDVYGARVTPAGGVLEPAGFPIATAVTDETWPAATAGSPGRVAVVYARVATEPPYGGESRAFVRFVDDHGPPPPPPPPPPEPPPPPRRHRRHLHLHRRLHQRHRRRLRCLRAPASSRESSACGSESRSGRSGSGTARSVGSVVPTRCESAA